MRRSRKIARINTAVAASQNDSSLVFRFWFGHRIQNPDRDIVIGCVPFGHVLVAFFLLQAKDIARQSHLGHAECVLASTRPRRQLYEHLRADGIGRRQMAKKAKAVGINHVALEVGNIEEALEFYGRFLDFELHRKSEDAAFIYFGDQFINFAKGREQGPDDRRHFGIAVDDKELVRETLAEMGVELLNGRFMDFLDPWGNRVEITTYTNIQFSKADHVLRGMGLAHLEKTENAIEELTKKGMAP